MILINVKLNSDILHKSSVAPNVVIPVEVAEFLLALPTNINYFSN